MRFTAFCNHFLASLLRKTARRTPSLLLCIFTTDSSLIKHFC
ncbi:unnamed protein product [Chondrus crispus]|uniref:Uncharacterized protein n=1 Tax=Chondrus crispus TaxID=2769 RepID=R7QKI1_CHOCR|nr:unnamed protein product [Chondrus crispus]CDF38584.1 unnamed protein product [Chondrus crispus]|eukprot:XP_005718489.1 unnamed protein product [Chondrus crispus]